MRIFEVIQLLELGNTQYPWSWKGTNMALFDYGSSAPMEVTFKKVGYSAMDIMDVSFKSSATDDYAAVDSGGKEVKIMSTVVAIVEEYYIKNKDNIDGLSAEGAMDAPAKRNKLYRRLLIRMQQKYGGTVKATGRETYWIAPNDTTDDVLTLLRGVKKNVLQLKSVAESGEDVLTDVIEFKVGQYTVALEEANLFRGGVIEFDEDNSNYHYNNFQFAVDLDKMYDMDTVNYIRELTADLKSIGSTISRLIK